MHFHLFLSSAKASPLLGQVLFLLGLCWSCLASGILAYHKTSSNWSLLDWRSDTGESGGQAGSIASAHIFSDGCLPGGWLSLGMFLPYLLVHDRLLPWDSQWFTGTVSWSHLFALQWTLTLTTSWKHRGGWKAQMPYRLSALSGSWLFDVSTMVAREISWMQWLGSFSCMLLYVDCHCSRLWSLGSWKWRQIWPALHQWLSDPGHLHPQDVSPWFLTSWQSGQNWMLWHHTWAAELSGLPWMVQRVLYCLHTQGLWSSSCPYICQTGHSQCHSSAGQLECRRFLGAAMQLGHAICNSTGDKMFLLGWWEWHCASGTFKKMKTVQHPYNNENSFQSYNWISYFIQAHFIQFCTASMFISFHISIRHFNFPLNILFLMTHWYIYIYIYPITWFQFFLSKVVQINGEYLS